MCMLFCRHICGAQMSADVELSGIIVYSASKINSYKCAFNVCVWHSRICLAACVLVVRLVEHARCCPNFHCGCQVTDKHLPRFKACQMGIHLFAYSSSARPGLVPLHTLKFFFITRSLLQRNAGCARVPVGALTLHEVARTFFANGAV